ncbi:MAG TPA: type II secretion system protein [Alphaproteobacteria bacterium]|nr:type II secretion system protein [Alphaproteobacteria bacterium]
MSTTCSSRRHGFTVLELMISVAIIGMLAAMAIPAFDKLQLAAKTGEVKLNLSAIRTAESLYYTEHRRFVGAPATPSGGPPPSTPSEFTGGGLSAFDALGFIPEGRVYFQYGIAVDPSSPLAYTADARADLDGDGFAQIWGYVHPDPDGNVVPVGEIGCTGVVIGASTGVREIVGPCGVAFGRSVF